MLTGPEHEPLVLADCLALTYVLDIPFVLMRRPLMSPTSHTYLAC